MKRHFSYQDLPESISDRQHVNNVKIKCIVFYQPPGHEPNEFSLDYSTRYPALVHDHANEDKVLVISN